jgi:hypothetical protein
MHVWHAVWMQYAHSVCLWHAYSILVYVIYVAYVMQVSVPCVQLECFLCGSCLHRVCIGCMCIELVAFLHVVQYACAFMNVYMWKVCRLCMACKWQVCSAWAACVKQVCDMYMACLGCVYGEVHMHLECVQYPCSMCIVFAPDAFQLKSKNFTWKVSNQISVVDKTATR